MTDKEVWEAARKFNETMDDLMTPNLAPNQKTNLYNRFSILLLYDCITQEDYESIMNIIENAEKRMGKKK